MRGYEVRTVTPRELLSFRVYRGGFCGRSHHSKMTLSTLIDIDSPQKIFFSTSTFPGNSPSFPFTRLPSWVLTCLTDRTRPDRSDGPLRVRPRLPRGGFGGVAGEEVVSAPVLGTLPELG